MPSPFRVRVAGLAALFSTLALGSAPAFGQGEAETLSASFRKAARRVLPAVVTVRPIGVASPFEVLPGPRPFGGGGPGEFGPDLPRREPGGSGVVIDADKGYVLTNDHVVQGASRVVVTLPDGRERTAEQVRRDPKSDLALLVIDRRGAQPGRVGRLRGAGDGRLGPGDRPAVRPVRHGDRRDRQRQGARDRHGDVRGPDPDRRGDQPGQLGGAAGQPERGSRRDQHGDQDAQRGLRGGRLRRAGGPSPPGRGRPGRAWPGPSRVSRHPDRPRRPRRRPSASTSPAPWPSTPSRRGAPPPRPGSGRAT